MKKVSFLVLASSLLISALPGSADAATLLLPPAGTMTTGSCFTIEASGAVKGAVGGPACGLNTWWRATVALPYIPNQGGGIDVFWRSTAPTNTQVRGRVRTYNGDGALFGAGSWVTGGGDKSTNVIRTLGNAMFEWEFQTSSSSSLPTLQYVSHNVM